MDEINKLLLYLYDMDVDDDVILNWLIDSFPRDKMIQCLKDLIIELDI